VTGRQLGDGAAGSAEPAKQSLRVRTVRAGTWTILAHFAGQVLRLFSSLVMTRLLVPEMFGVMAIATVVQISVALFSDIGIHQAIVQNRRGDSPDFLDTAWSMQIVRGWIIWAVCAAAGVVIYALAHSPWALGSVYSVAVLPLIIVSTSFSSVIMGFTSTKVITANRDLDMRKITLVDLFSQIAGLLLMISAAWWTRSIWSVVAGGLLTTLVSVTLSHCWLTGHRNRFRFDPAHVRELVSFGRWILISSALGVLAANGDRLLLGVWLSASLLGIYSIALNLATVIEGLAYKLFGGVSFAVFSEVVRESPARLREVYFRMRLPADAVFLGIAGLLYGAGPAVVDLLYDQRYAQAGPMLQTLSFGLFFTRYSLCTSTYLALGKTHYLTITQILNVVSMLVFIPTFYALYGVPGAIWGVALYRLPSAIAAWMFNARHGIHSILFEIAVLPAWVLGWGTGLAFTWTLGQIVHR
jgi:O-antigen/teichoic acid export membrane protein